MLPVHLSGHKLKMMLISLFIIAAVCFFFCPAAAEKKERTPEAECNIHQTSCVQTLNDYTVTLDIQPKPVTAMTDLTFMVTIAGKTSTGTPYIDLGMPGMKMGPNRVSLKSMGNGNYRGQGIIVRCPSGRRTWKASVTVPDAGTAEFVFDVVY